MRLDLCPNDVLACLIERANHKYKETAILIEIGVESNCEVGRVLRDAGGRHAKPDDLRSELFNTRSSQSLGRIWAV